MVLCIITLAFATKCFLYFRKRQKLVNFNTSDLENMNSSETVPYPESKTSSLALKPTIEEIHDRSENEEDTASKMSMKNVLYEPGKYGRY